MDLLLGLGTGIIFGFLLQRAEVLRFEKQIGFLRLQDMTIIKFMFSAVLVGLVGMYLCRDLGIIAFNLKATNIGAQVIGGTLFGIGWAVVGYCPGTSVGALAEGRWHAVWAILGMLAGAALYAELYPVMKRTVLSWGEFGKITIPGLLGVNHWVVIVLFVGGGLAMFGWFHKKGL